MPLRVRLQGAQGVCISLDSEAAILLRDALYDDADSQSSTHAEALISELLTGQGNAREQVISQEVAADLVRGIDRVAELYGIPSALDELRAYLQRAS